MIRRVNLLWVIPASRQTNLLSETPGSRQIFNMIKRGAGVGGINELIKLSEGDLSTCFLPFMCDVKAANSILAILTSLEQ